MVDLGWYRCSYPVVLPEVLCVRCSFIQDALLALESLDLQFEQVDVFHPLFVVEVTFTQDWLLDLDLLIQKFLFLAAVKQLLGQVVPLSGHLFKQVIGGESSRFFSVHQNLSIFTCSICFFCCTCSASASAIIFCKFCCSAFWLSMHCFVPSSWSFISCSSPCRNTKGR